MDNALNLNTDLTDKLMSSSIGKAMPQPTTEATEAASGFGQILKDSLNQVNKLQNDAAKATQTYAVGGPIELHQVMIAVEKAELSMELTTQLRNKMLSAYQEITRMGV